MSLHESAILCRNRTSAWSEPDEIEKGDTFQKMYLSEYGFAPQFMNPFRIGAVSLMPVDNLRGWRVDTVALLKELDSPIYRWPGGNFVSGYNWRDGIGDRDRRPPRHNPAWKGVEPNDVGILRWETRCTAHGSSGTCPSRST